VFRTFLCLILPVVCDFACFRDSIFPADFTKKMNFGMMTEVFVEALQK